MTHPTNPAPFVLPLSRRAFIKSLLIALTATSSLTLPLISGTNAASLSTTWPAWLSMVTGDKNAVAKLGQAYLAVHHEEQDSERLMNLIDQALGNLVDLADTRHDDPMHIARVLKQCVRKDYQNDDVISLQGWVLSRTEARLYALALLAQSE